MQEKRYVLGADPGKHGGIVLLSVDYNQDCIHEDDIIIYPIKVDKDNGINLHHLSSFLAPYADRIDRCVQEDVHALGFSSASGTFLFGYYAGMLWGALHVICPHSQFLKVAPYDWQAVAWRPEHIVWEEAAEGKRRKKDTKATSSNAAAFIYPGVSFKTKRSTYDHDGCVDAALIAHYGLLHLRGALPPAETKKKRKKKGKKK